MKQQASHVDPILSPADIDEAKKLYEDGESLAKVATHFDVEPGTVHRALRKWACSFVTLIDEVSRSWVS